SSLKGLKRPSWSRNHAVSFKCFLNPLHWVESPAFPGWVIRHRTFSDIPFYTLSKVNTSKRKRMILFQGTHRTKVRHRCFSEPIIQWRYTHEMCWSLSGEIPFFYFPSVRCIKNEVRFPINICLRWRVRFS